MFGIVRIIIGCIIFGCAAVLVRKSKVTGKPMWFAVCIGISLALTVALAFLPFENLFVTFRSPQDAYQYYTFGKPNIVLVIEGEACDLVVDRKNASETHLIIPKTADGWKIGMGRDTKKIAQTFADGISVDVYQYKDTAVFFITVFNSNGGGATVSDAYGTKFYALEKTNDLLGKTFVTYYGALSSFDSQYWVEVNGNKLSVK